MYEVKRLSGKYGVEDLIAANSRIPYKDVLGVLSRSHLQLLRIVKPMISTKLFEGIALNIPFLATIPSGEAEEIIREYSPSSFIVTTRSPEDVACAISDAMSKYKDSLIEDNRVQEFLQRFSRESLTIKLMGIIENNILHSALK